MIKDEYSSYKIVHHFDKLNELKSGIHVNPIQIHLIPTNRCNQSCTFCSYRMPESPCNQDFYANDEIPVEKLFEVIGSCSNLGVKAMQFTGGGEPLAHPNIKEVLQKTKNAGIEIALVSNGIALDNDLIQMLTDACWVRISIDAFNKETYSLLKRVKAHTFDKVLSNIKKLAKEKKKTVLGIGFVVNRENYTEIYDSCKMLKDIGVDNFRISASFTPLGLKYFDGIYETAKKLSEKAKNELEDEKFTVFNLFNDRISDLFIGSQDYNFCPMKELVPYIGADQNVYTCCILSYNKNGYIGSIKNQSFEELWKSEEKRLFFDKHNPKIYCRLPCMFEKKNEFINYCIKKDAKHTNYI